MATPCSVKAIDKYFECSPLLKVPNWYLKESYSSSASSNIKSGGKRSRLCFTDFRKILYLFNPVNRVKNSSRDGLVDFVDNSFQLTCKNLVQLPP